MKTEPYFLVLCRICWFHITVFQRLSGPPFVSTSQATTGAAQNWYTVKVDHFHNLKKITNKKSILILIY